MIKTSHVENEGAVITYDQVGAGPVLLLVVGGDGDSRRYESLAAILSADYTVVKYDRRASFRSNGDGNVDVGIDLQARDAASVLNAVCSEPAFVFGNSGGASIAIKLTEDFPNLVKELIAHEPPVVGLLPDADELTAHNHKVYQTYFSDSAGAAMREFASGFVGMEELMRNAPADQSGNMDHFLKHEFLAINEYVPDLERIVESGVPVVTAAGCASEDAYYARTARAMAEKLDCRYEEMTGHHVSFVTAPEVFAHELMSILKGMSSRPINN